jgi:hypothetical protein
MNNLILEIENSLCHEAIRRMENFPRGKSNGAPAGVLRLCAAAALRGMEGVVRSTFHFLLR